MKLNEKKKNTGYFAGIILFSINIVTSVILMISFISIDILPCKYLVPVIMILLLLTGLVFFTQVSGKGTNVGKLISIFMILAFIFITASLFKIHNMFLAISGPGAKIDLVSVVVLVEDPAEVIEDTSTYEFGIQKYIDRNNTDKTLKLISDKISCELKTVTFIDFNSQIEALYKKEAKAILLNEAFRDIINELMPDFNYRTKVLGYQEIETKIEIKPSDKTDNAARSIINVDSFIAYISGIDTYGTVSRTGRSDLNIIAAVNTAAKKILLINTPRDYYVSVPVDGGQMDKLTHAGIYGVDISMETLEQFYDIQIDYYVRINLTSLNDVVDALGGIDVESEYDFETVVDAIDASTGIIITPEYGYNAVEKYSFTKGINHLNGKAAMAFARERYAFAGGDNQRGRNQMLVIKAILNKASSPSVVSGIGAIIDTVSKNFETNMSSGEIYNMIKMQMNDGASWDIMMYNVKGTGDSRTTYSAGNQRLYVMIPDEETVIEAREKIMEVMDNK